MFGWTGRKVIETIRESSIYDSDGERTNTDDRNRSKKRTEGYYGGTKERLKAWRVQDREGEERGWRKMRGRLRAEWQARDRPQARMGAS